MFMTRMVESIADDQLRTRDLLLGVGGMAGRSKTNTPHEEHSSTARGSAPMAPNPSSQLTSADHALKMIELAVGFAFGVSLEQVSDCALQGLKSDSRAEKLRNITVIAARGSVVSGSEMRSTCFRINIHTT